MPGIVVGVDGSANARFALEWAIKEGAIKNAPVTVVTVNEVAASFWTGNPITVPADEIRLEELSFPECLRRREGNSCNGQALPLKENTRSLQK